MFLLFYSVSHKICLLASRNEKEAPEGKANATTFVFVFHFQTGRGLGSRVGKTEFCILLETGNSPL